MANFAKVKCTRCGYEWFPKVEKPKCCSKCSSPAWYKEIMKPYTKEERKQKRREASRRWCRKNPETMHKYHLRYRQNPIHQEHELAYSRKYNFEHKDEIAETSRKRHQKLRREIFSHYGMVCACCGESELDFLCIDHINGGGKRHFAIVGLGTAFYCWLKKNNFPEGYQALCFNCNEAKSHFGGCPHQRNKQKDRI